MSALDTTSDSGLHKAPRRSRHPSTASIRSTASTRSPRPSVWRPPNSLRARNDSLSSATVPTISCVFAGAEMTSGNGSVRDRMEAFVLPPADTSSPTASTSELPHDTPVIPEVESESLPPDAPEAVHGPEAHNVVAFPVSISPPTKRSSTWFGSLSRAKGKEKLAEVQAVAPASASTPNLSLASASPSPLPSASSFSDLPTSSDTLAPERADARLLAEAQPIAVQKTPTKRGSWFSSSPSQPSPLRGASSPLRSPPHPIYIPSTPNTAQSDIPSSLDSSVPSPMITPPPDVHTSYPLSEDGHNTVRGRQRLASLNPSTSRFGISLPLLGSNKIPGGNTTSVGLEVSNTVLNVNEGTAATHTEEIVVRDSNPSQPETMTISTTTINSTTTSGTSPAAPTSDGAAAMVHSSTWWDYVGWGPTPVTNPSTHDGTEDDGEVTPRPPLQSFATEGDSDPNTTPSTLDDDPTKTVAPGAAPAISVSNGDQTSWYYPWAWYGSASSSVPPMADLAPSEDDTVAREQEEKSAQIPEANTTPADATSAASAMETAATAAQQRYWTSFFTSSYSQSSTGATSTLPSETTTTAVTEASMTLPDPTPNVAPGADDATPQLHPTTSTTSVTSNPIGDSINSNRTGWISFITNTATLGYAARKSVTSGEPEVMYLDSDSGTDDGNEGISTPVSEVSPQNGNADKSKIEPEGKQKAKDEELPRQNGNVLNGKPVVSSSTKPAAPPLTISDSVKRQVANNSSTPNKRAVSPSPSVASKRSVASSTGTRTPAGTKASSIAPPRTPTPNLLLPTWRDTFHTPPRSSVPQRLLDANGKGVGRAVMEKTMRFVSGVLFATDNPAGTRRSSSASGRGKGKEREEREREKRFEEWGLGLPRAWDVLKPAAAKGPSSETGEEAKVGDVENVLRGCRRVVVIGIHGWFPGAVMRSVLGEPTGTSTKFVNMMVQALEEFQTEYGVSLETITRIPLEGEGTIDKRVEKLYTNLTENSEWMSDLHAADVIFVATHSQGSIVSTHLLDKLIKNGHIRTGGSDVSKDPNSISRAAPSASAAHPLPPPPAQRVCCLALCGIHLGPLRYLSSSSLVLPYIQYFESAAAKELFEFQTTESDVSKAYVSALRNVVDNGTKMVYVASLNDQVVPIYSGLFTAASHPLILRALYIDGDAYHSSDFLSNLLVLLLRLFNSGLSDSGLLAHLSEATAGSLNGVGHSTAYEEISTYALAVKYLFLTNSGFDTHPKLTVESFDANLEQNDYEIPWSLRDLIADDRVAHFFSREISELATAFRQWHPKTTILRDLKRKLQPIQRLPPSFVANTGSSASVSKL
ncbi:hypothetical protein C8J57DRAFT_1268974 [Mycena rebaudengoi]|nr:hypothetical protein C8J57DRAFT_1268974 [Mycena rebaudengoi]